ncbi:terminase TerL endonuclease subunit [Bacillus thuringiensis]|uniref:terminase TerL endonuclease subunit n=1 Tax=Bacillus thuringiensis TaxID=1428 RepID=UPI003709A1E3
MICGYNKNGLPQHLVRYVDYELFKTHIRNMEKDHKFKIKEICADPWICNAIHARHGSRRVYDDRNTPRDGNFIRSYKRFREQVYLKKVIHNNNPVLNWATSNAITKQDANE